MQEDTERLLPDMVSLSPLGILGLQVMCLHRLPVRKYHPGPAIGGVPGGVIFPTFGDGQAVRCRWMRGFSCRFRLSSTVIFNSLRAHSSSKKASQESITCAVE